MKRTLSLLLCAALALTMMAGCGQKSATGSASSAAGSESASTSESGSGSGGDSAAFTMPNLMVLSGPTGVGAAKLMHDQEYAKENGTTPDGGLWIVNSAQVVTDNTEVSAALTNGDADIAAIATNVAATLNAKTDGLIQVLAVNTLGGYCTSWRRGDSVPVHGRPGGQDGVRHRPGSPNPEYILNYLLERK